MANKLHQLVAERFGIPYPVVFGKYIGVRCFYHRDKKPSAYIIFDKKGGWFGCKGCHKSVSIFQLRKDMGIDERDMGDKYMPKRNTSNWDIDSIAVDTNNWLGQLDNFSDTEVTSVTLAEAVEEFIEKKGISQETIDELGGWVSDKGYLSFEYGHKKRKVGRYLFKHDEDHPRFLNTEDSGKGFFGEESIRKYDELILVEGLTDYLSLYQLGYRNIICSFGSSISDEQAYLLRGKTVFILFDKDYAGYQGARRKDSGAVYRLQEFGATAIVIELYDADDPDCEKSDVNQLCREDSRRFDMWLTDNISKFGTYDKDYYEKAYRKEKNLKYYKTSLLPMSEESIYVIGGLPGSGKSTSAVTIVDELVGQDARVLYWTGELSKRQIIARLESKHSIHTWAEIEADKDIVEEKVQKKVAKVLSKTKIVGAISLQELFHSKKHFDVAIIDYVQLLAKTIPDIKDRVSALDKCCQVFANLSADYGKLVVVVSRMPASAFGGQTEGHLFSDSGQLIYSAQGALIMKKVAKDGISMNIVKNTRGEIGSKLFTIDYGHQKIIGTTPQEMKRKKRSLFEDVNLDEID